MILNKIRHNFAHNLDLKIAFIVIIVSIIFILVPPFDQTFVRIFIAIPFLLFFPGYLFIALMFPRKGELTAIERFTLSIGLSIAIFVFDGFGLNYTTWGFRPNSIVISLSIFMFFTIITAYVRRRKLGEFAYDFSRDDIISFIQILKSKDTETGPEYDPGLEKTLIRTMIFLIILVSAVVVYANVTREPEKFTAFYILGPNGMAENYPENITINTQMNLMTGIENHEFEPVNYTIRVKLGEQILKEQEVNLEPNAKWLENVTFIPVITQSIALSAPDAKSKLELSLLKDKQSYRSVHLWVKPFFNITDYSPLLSIENGDMEQASGWNFTSTDENITGYFVNTSWTSPVQSFMVSFAPNRSLKYAELYQDLKIDKATIADISFYVKDSSSNVTSNITMQLIMDNNVLWEKGVGNKSWEQVHVPVFLSKDSRLAFRIINKIPLNESLTFWWDDIKIGKYTDRSFANKSIPQQTGMVFLGNDEKHQSFTIRGIPFQKKGHIKIDGSNFPGFYYNIDEGRGYEELDLNISENGTVETGDATYTTIVYGNEISIAGIKYKLINKTDISLLSKALVKNESKKLNLSEKWNVGGDFYLTLSLINSKGDAAMLELRKGNKQLDSRLIGRGNVFEYRTSVAKNTTTIFRTKINSISYDSVNLKETDLYSDAPMILKAGVSTGDFEVTNVSSDSIKMTNYRPIEINDNVLILGGSIKLKVINDLVFPYSGIGEIRGLPQSIQSGNSVIINGRNYPGFHYDFYNNFSLEELIMNVSYNWSVDPGNAIYRATRYGNDLYFLGKSYWLPKPERINFVSSFSIITETIDKNRTVNLNNDYKLRLKEISESGFEVIINKAISKSDFQLLNRTNDSKFFKDIYYEMYSTTFLHGKQKSNKLYGPGDKFEYWVEYDDDKPFMEISGKIISIEDHNVTMEIMQYEKPKEFLTGMTFNDFEMVSMTQNTITLSNTKPIKFEPGKETTILGGLLRLRKTTNGSNIYPIGGNIK